MPLQFTDPKTAERFEATVEKDRKVHKGAFFSGNLSNIHLGMAAAMVREGSDLIKLKEGKELPAEEKTSNVTPTGTETPSPKATGK